MCILVSTAFALNVHIQGTIYFANDLMAFNTNTLILCMISGQYLRCYRSIIFRKSFVFTIFIKRFKRKFYNTLYFEKPTKFEKNVSTFTWKCQILSWRVFLKFCVLLRTYELWCHVEFPFEFFDKMVNTKDFLKIIDL